MTHVFITNGTGGCGKDTFADLLFKHVDGVKISSIDPITQHAGRFGWTGGKTDKDRKFLSDLKRLVAEYADIPFKYMARCHEFYTTAWDHPQCSYKPHVLIFDIREPEEIERAKQAFKAKTILIKNDRVAPITSNMSDSRVFDYEYDFVIENNGSLEDYEETVMRFAKENIL